MQEKKAYFLQDMILEFLLELIWKLSRQLGIKRHVVILESDKVKVPVTCRSFRSYIILPTSGMLKDSLAGFKMAIYHAAMTRHRSQAEVFFYKNHPEGD